MRTLSALLALLHFNFLFAQPAKAPTEDDYYKLVKFDVPKGEVLECGGLDFMPDGRLAVGTRRGEIWMVENPLAADPKDAKFSRYAHGLHEILGLAANKDWLYVTQRCDVSRLKAGKMTKKAELFEIVNDGWEINGDYHEYAFGSRFDKDGNIWVVLCLTGSFNSNSKYRGWCLKVTPDGKLIPTASGVRSPGGIGMNADGDMFFTDNQGPWNGACGLKHLVPGGFVGHPDSFKWYDEANKLNPKLGPKPLVPKSGSRIHLEARKIPQFIPTAVIFPYNKMGQSAAGIECDLSGGKFGPFEKQLFVGDQTHSTVMRVFLEKVDLKDIPEEQKGKAEGVRYQGACFPFRQGFSCGIVPVRFAKDGSLFAGGTNRGWGSRGGKPYSLERLVWTGKVPFEIHEMRAKPDGFELTFTQPVDAMTAGDIKSYNLKTFTYIYQAAYGSPEVDATKPEITKVEVAKDKKSVRLWVNGLQQGHIHELAAAGVRSANSLPLLHNQAYYTMNYIPTK
jgi:glucose/arabinose dehydrogenase